MKVISFSETSVTSTSLHGIITQKTMIRIFTALKIHLVFNLRNGINGNNIQNITKKDSAPWSY
jgi:hypothetical protein